MRLKIDLVAPICTVCDFPSVKEREKRATGKQSSEWQSKALGLQARGRRGPWGDGTVDARHFYEVRNAHPG